MLYSRRLYLPLVIFLLASCKISVTVPEGGKVISATGTYTCTAEAPCNIEVDDFTFDETFTAKPNEGYDFVAWETSKDTVCSGTSKPCRLFSSGLDALEAVADLLNSDKTYYLTPNFVRKSNQLRQFAEGDTISYRGSISVEDSAGVKTDIAITAIQAFQNSESSIDNQNLMLQLFTLRLNSDGSEFPEASLYWQEDNGSWFDASDPSGFLLVDAQANQFGVINYRSPFTIGDEETVVADLVDFEDISNVVASGVLTTETTTRKNITVPLGRFSAFKVKFRVELDIPGTNDVTSLVLEQVHWLVPYIGPVKKRSVQRSYDSGGNLIETQILKLEATQVNF